MGMLIRFMMYAFSSFTVKDEKKAIMKKTSALFALLLISTFCFSQSSLPLHQYRNGWHQFTAEGVLYDVEIINGSLNTTGNVIWPDGSKYSGMWLNNNISGLGTYTWPNGDRYEGSFRNGQPNGHGTMYWNDGRKHAGKWKAGSRHGKGKQWDVDGNRIKGEWQNDKLVSLKESDADQLTSRRKK